MASLLPKLNPEFTGVNPKTGEYLSPDERKQVFKLRKRKLDPSKVFDKSAIVKVDKPQANMDSIMKSIANIQETLQKLQSVIITDAEEKKKDTTKKNRQLLLEMINKFETQFFLTGTDKNLFSFVSTKAKFYNITNI